MNGLVECSSTIMVELSEVRRAIVGSAECLSDLMHLREIGRSACPVRCRESSPDAPHRSRSRRTQSLNSCLPKNLLLVSGYCSYRVSTLASLTEKSSAPNDSVACCGTTTALRRSNPPRHAIHWFSERFNSALDRPFAALRQHFDLSLISVDNHVRR